MLSKRKIKEFKLIDKIQTIGAIGDFYENESTAMSTLDVDEQIEQHFKNIINGRREVKN